MSSRLVLLYDTIWWMCWWKPITELGLRNNKNMYFHIPRVEKFSFDGDKSLYNLVLAISAGKMLRHGCQGYVTLVRDTFI